MRRRFLLATGLASILTTHATTASAATATTAARLRIGLSPGNAPFTDVASDGRPVGFEVGLAQALCERLGVPFTPVLLDFDGLIPALQSRKIDAIMASMAVTSERQRVIAFSTPYYYSPSRLVARHGSKLTVSPAGLSAKRIGVERGTVHERFLAEVFKDSQVARYATLDQAFLDLKSGRLDALLADAVAADFGFLRKPEGHDFEFIGPEFRDERYFGQGMAVGMRQADAANLGRRVNQAIAALRANGTLKALNDRHFSLDLISPPH